jgi:hypothetical protein
VNGDEIARLEAVERELHTLSGKVADETKAVAALHARFDRYVDESARVAEGLRTEAKADAERATDIRAEEVEKERETSEQRYALKWVEKLAWMAMGSLVSGSFALVVYWLTMMR